MSQRDDRWKMMDEQNLDPDSFLGRAVSRLKAFEDRHYVFVSEAGGSEAIKVGDRISFYYTPYQHTASMVVTKINKKSIVAYEVERSYGAGTRWVLHKEWNGWEFARHDSSFNSLEIPDGVRIY